MYANIADLIDYHMVNQPHCRLGEVIINLGRTETFLIRSARQQSGNYHNYTAMRRQNAINRKIFKTIFFCIFYISPSIFFLCQKFLAKKLLQSTFCNQTLYITNICRVISRVTKSLSSTNSEMCVFPAHDSIMLIYLLMIYYCLFVSSLIYLFNTLIVISFYL